MENMDNKLEEIEKIKNLRNGLRLEWEAKGNPYGDFYLWLLETMENSY